MAEEASEVIAESPAKRSKAERDRRKRKNFQLRWKFGISVGDFDRLVSVHGGKCAICGSHPKEPNRSLHVDHCHKTGEIRGLLCTRCNLVLGGMRDDLEFAKRFINYLRRPPVRILIQSRSGRGPLKLPKLCRRKDTGRAYATDNLTRRPVYFGMWGTPESEKAYRDWLDLHAAKLEIVGSKHAMKKRLADCCVREEAKCSSLEVRQKNNGTRDLRRMIC